MHKVAKPKNSIISCSVELTLVDLPVDAVDFGAGVGAGAGTVAAVFASPDFFLFGQLEHLCPSSLHKLHVMTLDPFPLFSLGVLFVGFLFPFFVLICVEHA